MLNTQRDITGEIHNQANSRSQSYWSSAIKVSWQKATSSIIDTGRLPFPHAQLQEDGE